MRTRRLKAHPDASSGFYHCMSRVVDRQFVFGEIEKEHFAGLMRQYARFCGIQILTFCLMGNHFHLLIEVPKRPESPPNDAELLQRISAIYPPAHVEQIRKQLTDTSLISIQKDALRQRFWQRMGDLSQYLKELKQRFSQWHNLRQGRRGTLWEERFKSVLIGAEGSALSTIAAYIDLNPVRAGLVVDPARYRWSGYGQAMAGRPEALSGYQALATVRDSLSLNPAQALKHYRAGLFDYAERRGVFSSTPPVTTPRANPKPRLAARRNHSGILDWSANCSIGSAILPTVPSSAPAASSNPLLSITSIGSNENDSPHLTLCPIWKRPPSSVSAQRGFWLQGAEDSIHRFNHPLFTFI